MTGFEPDTQAINHLQNFLANHINKPNGIKIVTKEIPPSADTTLIFIDMG
jgi:hypothetical protein